MHRQAAVADAEQDAPGTVRRTGPRRGNGKRFLCPRLETSARLADEEDPASEPTYAVAPCCCGCDAKSTSGRRSTREGVVPTGASIVGGPRWLRALPAEGRKDDDGGREDEGQKETSRSEENCTNKVLCTTHPGVQAAARQLCPWGLGRLWADDPLSTAAELADDANAVLMHVVGRAPWSRRAPSPDARSGSESGPGSDGQSSLDFLQEAFCFVILEGRSIPRIVQCIH